MDEKSQIELAKGIEQTAERALDFIEKIVAGPIMEGTGILTDKINYWRFKNRVNIIIKAREFLKSKGIETPKKIPIKDVSTLLEFASFEEDEVMQDSWANLLANAMNPNNQFDACHVFSQVMNQISVNEFYALKHLKSRSFLLDAKDRPYLEKNELIRNSNTDFHTGTLLIDNLLRLRLIEQGPPKYIDNSDLNKFFTNFEKRPESEIIDSNNYRISEFGAELIKQITE